MLRVEDIATIIIAALVAPYGDKLFNVMWGNGKPGIRKEKLSIRSIIRFNFRYTLVICFIVWDLLYDQFDKVFMVKMLIYFSSLVLSIVMDMVNRLLNLHEKQLKYDETRK